MGHRSYEHTSRSLTHDKHVLYQKVLSASTDQFSNEHHKHHIKNTEETFFLKSNCTVLLLYCIVFRRLAVH